MPVDRQREVNDMRNPVSGLPRRSLNASLPSWPDGRTVRIRDDLVASILFFGQLMMVCTAAVTWLTFGSSNVVASIFSVSVVTSCLVTWRKSCIARRAFRRA